MSNDLTVVEQREVEFYDDQLTAVRANDGCVCNVFGIEEQGAAY